MEELFDYLCVELEILEDEKKKEVLRGVLKYRQLAEGDKPSKNKEGQTEEPRDVLEQFREYFREIANKSDISTLESNIANGRIKSINVYDKQMCWDITGQLPSGPWMYLEEWMQDQGYVYYYARHNFEESKRERDEKRIKRQVLLDLITHFSEYNVPLKMNAEEIQAEIREFIESELIK